MAEVVLSNIGDFISQYNSEQITFSTNEVSTTIVQGITATKTADKALWVSGPLEYQIVVQNTTGLPLTDGIFNDQLDTSLITLDEDYGVYIGGTKVTHTYTGGLVSANLPEIPDGGSVTIVFHVLQV